MVGVTQVCPGVTTYPRKKCISTSTVKKHHNTTPSNVTRRSTLMNKIIRQCLTGGLAVFALLLFSTHAVAEGMPEHGVAVPDRNLWLSLHCQRHSVPTGTVSLRHMIQFKGQWSHPAPHFVSGITTTQQHQHQPTSSRENDGQKEAAR